MSQQISKSRKILERLEGGYHQVETEEYWIVRLIYIGKKTGQIHVGNYLRCKNGYRANQGRKRAWELTSSSLSAYCFKSKAEAMKGARAAVIKDRISGAFYKDKQSRGEVVEVVKVNKRLETIKSEIKVVESRPGCNPMLTLAIEAAQEDQRQERLSRNARTGTQR